MPASDELALPTRHCMFCDIAAGRMDSDLAFESDDIVAFHDVNPQAPVHVLVIPREHISGVGVVESGHEPLMGRLILAAVAIAQSQGLSNHGFRLVVNQGDGGGQTVEHLHIHLLGGRKLGWPPG